MVIKIIHSFILMILILFCSGCSHVNKNKVNTFSDESQTLEKSKFSVYSPKKNKKNFLIIKNWLQKCSIVLTDNIDSSVQLKDIANSFGLQVNFTKEIKINYKAKNKRFIDILLDIFDQLNLKIMINGINGIVTEDEMYLHNYSLGNLSSIMSTEFATSVDHSFGDSTKSNLSKNSYKNNNNYYEVISQNLSVILPKPYSFTINPQAGILTIIAPQKYHKKILMYLNSIKKRLNDQILVEAKLLEIELYEEYSYGVDLDGLKNFIIDSISVENINSINSGNILTFFTKVSDSLLRRNVFSYLSTFGKIKSVSNPYLLISNNHVGIFKAVENKIYFKFKTETIIGSENKPGARNRQSEFITCPVGVTFSVHAVKLDNDLIKLYIKPTITDVSKEIEDAGYRYVSNEDSNNSGGNVPKIPVIKTREMESVLILKNNEYAIIGGLIDQNQRKEKHFLKKYSSEKKTELVIFLKVSSIENNEETDIYEFLVDI